MDDQNLYSLLANRFLMDPSRQFAVLEDGRHYSYSDVDQITGRFATALFDLGVQPGDRVAAQVEKSIEAFLLYLATLRVGGVFLPLNTAYTPARDFVLPE